MLATRCGALGRTRLLPSTRLLPVDPRLALEEIHRLGFDEAEVNFVSFMYTGLDYPSYPNMLRLTLLHGLRVGLRVPVVHAPWEEYFLPLIGRGVEYAVSEALLLAEIAASYGVEVMVLHPFSRRRLGSGKAWWLNKAFFGLLASRIEAEGIDVVVAVENTNKAEPWNNVETTRRLVEETASPRIGLCLDFGHAGVNGYTPGQAYAAAGSPKCLHVHDNHGSADEHLVPGCGSLNWETFAEHAGQRRGTPEYAVVEVDCSGSLAPCRTRLKVAYEASRLALAGVLE